jgi:PA domain
MRKYLSKAKSSLVLFAMMMVLACSATAFAGGVNIVIINVDGPNEGFNDPTPVAPVGGNPGTTRGAQRLFAFQHAATIWGATLDSAVTVRIQAAFNPLGANVLGSAGPTYLASDFGGVGLYTGSEFPATWYFGTLADKRAGTELHPTPNFPDINCQFSSDFNFYLGVDNNHGAQNDLVAVLLHEFGHGLNFANQVNESNGRNFGATNADPEGGLTDIFARYTFDNTTGLSWDQMTRAQRQASAINFGNVVWEGANVTAGAPSVLVLGSPEVRVLSPAAIAGTKQFGTASFGPQISSLASPIIATIVPAVDVDEDGATAAFTTTDGCSPFSNAAAVAGNIALIERGGCGFAVKARNASVAGAAGVIIYNQLANAAAAPPGMAGDGINDLFVTAPTVSLSRADGLAIVGQPGATGFIGKDPNIRAGADADGRVRLYMPNPVIGGSSGSHYDNIAFRNLLMEPSINGDLTHNLKAPDDLTLELMRDVGWFPDFDLDGKATADDCDDTSDFRPTVAIGTCDTGITNFMFTDGCTFMDKIQAIAATSPNHGIFVARVGQLANALKKNGTITAAQKDALMNCAGSDSIP